MKTIKEYLEQKIKVKKIDETAKELKKAVYSIILSTGVRGNIMYTSLKTDYIKNTISMGLRFKNHKRCEFTETDIKYKKDDCISLIKELSRP